MATTDDLVIGTTGGYRTITISVSGIDAHAGAHERSSNGLQDAVKNLGTDWFWTQAQQSEE